MNVLAYAIVQNMPSGLKMVTYRKFDSAHRPFIETAPLMPDENGLIMG